VISTVTITPYFESICNRSRARRVNSGKITISDSSSPFDALVREECPHPAAQNLVTKTRNTRLSCGENPKSLSQLGSVPGRDGETDRQTELR